MLKKIVFWSVICLAFNLYAETFFVANPEVSENEKQYERTLKTLIIQNLENKRHQISEDPKTNMSIKSSLLKLGDSYILSVTKTTSAGVNSEKMKVKQIDDLDVVVDRIMDAVMGNKTAKETLKIDTVTEQEKEQKTKRIEVTRQWMFGLGPAWLVNLGDTSAYNILIGYTWGLDHNFDLTIKWDLSDAKGDSDAGFSQITIGGNYFFSNDVHAPYVSLDLGYGGADHSNKKEGNGWVTSLGGGMKFFRASSVNFGIEGRYTTIFEKIADKTPSQFGFKVIVFF